MKICLHANRFSSFLLLSCIPPLILYGTAYGGVWTAVDDMSTARSNHTATLLGNGRVLIAGGYNASGPPYDIPALSSAEFYISSTNTWSPAPSMSTPRRRHSATLLKNGRVLVAGGYHDNFGGCLNTTEIYDPLANSWSMAASMVAPRCGHTATLLQDGRVLVVGGAAGDYYYGGPEEVYDPSTNAWTQVNGLYALNVSSHSAALLQDGRVLVAGGSSIFGDAYATAHLFNPSINTWSAAAGMASPREGHSATLLADGRVLVAGGNFYNYEMNNIYPSPEIYDPSTNTWSTANNLIVNRDRHGATLLHDGSVLVFGGWNNSGWHAGTEQYNPTLDFWRVMKNMIAVRAGFTATLLPDGSVLVTGGFNASTGFLSSAEVYDPVVTAEPFPWPLFLPSIFSASSP